MKTIVLALLSLVGAACGDAYYRANMACVEKYSTQAAIDACRLATHDASTAPASTANAVGSSQPTTVDGGGAKVAAVGDAGKGVKVTLGDGAPTSVFSAVMGGLTPKDGGGK